MSCFPLVSKGRSHYPDTEGGVPLLTICDRSRHSLFFFLPFLQPRLLLLRVGTFVFPAWNSVPVENVPGNAAHLKLRIGTTELVQYTHIYREDTHTDGCMYVLEKAHIQRYDETENIYIFGKNPNGFVVPLFMRAFSASVERRAYERRGGLIQMFVMHLGIAGLRRSPDKDTDIKVKTVICKIGGMPVVTCNWAGKDIQPRTYIRARTQLLTRLSTYRRKNDSRARIRMTLTEAPD